LKLTKSFTKLTGVFLVLSLILLFFMAACATVTPPPRPTVQDKIQVPEPKKPQAEKPSALIPVKPSTILSYFVRKWLCKRCLSLPR